MFLEFPLLDHNLSSLQINFTSSQNIQKKKTNSMISQNASTPAYKRTSSPSLSAICKVLMVVDLRLAMDRFMSFRDVALMQVIRLLGVSGDRDLWLLGLGRMFVSHDWSGQMGRLRWGV